MSVNEYQFFSHWRVPATVQQISEILSNPVDFPRWWPAVYLGVKQIDAGSSDGVGRVVEFHTRGWLPYTLRWSSRITESRKPYGFSLEAWGDLDGRGVWTFTQDGAYVNIAYDWRVRAEKPILRYLSFLLKPLFSANHRWAMARGEESLRAELGRRAGAGQHVAGQTS